MRLNTPPLPTAMLSLMITIACCVTVVAQDPQTPQGPPPTGTDPIEQLHLTPEQRQRIRAIRESSRQERAMVNQRLRQTNVALQQAMDAETIDEALIEERLRDAAAAQAAAMRLRIQTELKIRRVLSREQLVTLKSLQVQAQELNRERNQNQRPVRQGNVLRPNQRNGIAPIFPRRDGVQRNPRP
jgi:Spy/CpxP family protein refolding chaperone